MTDRIASDDPRVVMLSTIGLSDQMRCVAKGGDERGGANNSDGTQSEKTDRMTLPSRGCA
jgi:hypothetical protein